THELCECSNRLTRSRRDYDGGWRRKALQHFAYAAQCGPDESLVPGIFDGLVSPIIVSWGFGPGKRLVDFLVSEEHAGVLERARGQVGPFEVADHQLWFSK